VGWVLGSGVGQVEVDVVYGLRDGRQDGVGN
jgi:hypothetical protein